MNEIGPRTEHPLIGINGFYTATDGVPRVEVRLAYASAIQNAHGVPVVIPPVGAERELRRFLRCIDGLVLSGGDDFDTERLGLGPTHGGALVTPGAKQDFDMRLAELAIEEGIPVLGICYGMQALALASPRKTPSGPQNAVTGASLLQHLPEDRPGCQEHGGRRLHPVRIAPDSKLRRLVGVDTLNVVSSHHQAVGAPGPLWDVVGRDDEDLIEAIELRSDLGHPFCIGVQWHPEASPEGTPHDKVFRGLVGAAGMLASRREYPK
ncbi:MAG: putative glutamine amidotransferase [Planctomycetota bacterium]|jgi:putative glutamine amidotransferase